MADLSIYSKPELASMVERGRSIAKRAREATKVVTTRGTKLGLTVVSGYAVGLAKNKMGEGGKLLIPGTPVEADLAAGVVLGLGGVFGMAGDRSDELAAIGGGILSGYAAVAGYLHGLPGKD